MNKRDEVLNVIEAMNLDDLREQWEKLSGNKPPRAMSKELLRLAVAYRRKRPVNYAVWSF